MASQALYLKWRPQRFEDVVGQEHVTQTLQNALRAERISHAYLFSGPRGTGKTTMARLLAKAVNCVDEDVSIHPCNECHMCTAINEGRALDLIEMDAASHTGVDNVREAIRDKVGFRPAVARYKVYVIDEVHMLSTSAFNALLKTLEEPPEHVIFCLATTEPHKILPTILSRCQRFDFHRIPLAALVARLQHIADQEGIEIEPDALQFIARTATGSARDGISLLDQLASYGDGAVTLQLVRSVLGLSDEQLVHELVMCLAAHDAGGGLDVIHRVVEQGVDARQYAQQVVDYARLVLLTRVAGASASVDVGERMQAELSELAGRLSTRELVRSIKLFNQAQLDLRGSDQSRMALELALVEATLPEGEPVDETVPVAPARPAPRPSAVRENSPGPVEVAPPSAPPAAPPRISTERKAEGSPEPVEPSEQAVSSTDPQLVAVTMEEVNASWDEVKQLIKSESAQAEALVNSALSREVESVNRLVFRLASELLASKLEKEENKRIVEKALTSVLGKPCRVRGEAGTTGAPSQEVRSASPSLLSHRAPGSHERGELVQEDGSTEIAAPEDHYREAASDPVIQDLISRGGKITDVQLLSEE